MNDHFPAPSVPPNLKVFDEPCWLLPGESQQEYEAIRQMVIEDVGPRNNFEWLWVLDLIELSWEVLRYRRLKERILQTCRANAIASVLQQLDGTGMPAHSREMVQSRSRHSALEWYEDGDAASEIEARLERNGFDVVAINAEVFIQARDSFGLFDGLMQSAQVRRATLLRDIALRREFNLRSHSHRNERKRAKFWRPNQT